MTYHPDLDIAALYASFSVPITEADCGKLCAPYNPSGKPFCCDICVAVPVALKEEWAYLKPNTRLWHRLRGDECPKDPIDVPKMKAETPAYMHLMACRGPEHCERDFRTLSCRQFPFSPYITTDDRFIGLTYNWDRLVTNYGVNRVRGDVTAAGHWMAGAVGSPPRARGRRCVVTIDEWPSRAHPRVRGDVPFGR